MQRSITWWESLTDDQRAEILGLAPGPLPEWVLDTMEAAEIPLSRATIAGEVVRLPPTVTSDFLATQRARQSPDEPR